MGSAQSVLQLSHPVNPVFLCGAPMAGVMDSKPGVNLMPFGLCKSPANPVVAAATAAAGGKLQEMPCLPSIVSPWVNGKLDVSVKGAPAILDTSKCTCLWAGVIEVAVPGQKSVTCVASPTITEPEAPAATPKTGIGETKTAGAANPQTMRGGSATGSKKGTLAAILATLGGIFGARRAGDAETVASPDATVFTPADTVAETPQVAAPTKVPTEAAQKSSAASAGKSAGGTQGTLIVNVTGPTNASFGQKAEYQAHFNTNDVSDELRQQVRWGVNEVGVIDPEELTVKGDNIALVIREEWAGLNIRVTACVNSFSDKVGQKTKIARHPQAVANRAKVCASCKMKSDCKHVDNIYGRPITDADYIAAAKELGIDVALMKAIGKNESNGSGFYGEGKAKILYERHYMYNLLAKQKQYGSAKAMELQKECPTIVHKSPNVIRTGSFTKLKKAKEIDVGCAIQSCSWGRFQVTGDNYRWASYSTPQELEMAMNTCELLHFKFFVAYLKNKKGMLKALSDKDWEEIAYIYNGPQWKTHNPKYAGNLQENYNYFKNNTTETV